MLTSPLTLPATGRLNGIGYRSCVANRAAMPSEQPSDGIVLGGTARVRHRSLKSESMADISLVYGNSQLTGTGEQSGANPITVRCAIEYPAGTFYPLFFRGRRDAVIEPDAVVETDPLGIEIPADTVFYTRTHVTVATPGETFPLGFFNNHSSLGEGHDYSDTPVDKTLAGTVTGQTGRIYSPHVILARTRGVRPTVALIGASTLEGNGETTGGDSDGNKTAVARAIGNRFGYFKLTRASDRASYFVAAHHRRMAVLGDRASHVINNLGLNDILAGTAVATVQNHLLTIWNLLHQRGFKVLQCTYQPVTTSTDSWATLENQTPNPWTANRIAMNNWIRTVPAPLVGIIDLADLHESGRDSGLWRVDGTPGKYTVDGLHPTSFGYAQAATGISIEQLIAL